MKKRKLWEETQQDSWPSEQPCVWAALEALATCVWGVLRTQVCTEGWQGLCLELSLGQSGNSTVYWATVEIMLFSWWWVYGVNYICSLWTSTSLDKSPSIFNNPWNIKWNYQFLFSLFLLNFLYYHIAFHPKYINKQTNKQANNLSKLFFPWTSLNIKILLTWASGSK